MTSTKPYLMRAIYAWIVDNGYTPYVAIDTTFPYVTVPQQYIKDNTIILNISASAAHQLLINNETLTFKARFGGVAHDIYIPLGAVTAIYAAENNQGMNFPKEEPTADHQPTDIPPLAVPPKVNKLQLKIIPGGKDQTSH